MIGRYFMGEHKLGLVPVGAYVNEELRSYLDKIVHERGFLTRSDAIRAILREHRAVFSEGIDRNQALTPTDAVVNDNAQGFLKKRNINEIRGDKK